MDELARRVDELTEEGYELDDAVRLAMSELDTGETVEIEIGELPW